MAFKKRDIEGLFDQIDFFSAGRDWRSYNSCKEFVEDLMKDTQKYVNSHTFGFFGDSIKEKLNRYLSDFTYSDPFPPFIKEDRNRCEELSIENVKGVLKRVINYS